MGQSHFTRSSQMEEGFTIWLLVFRTLMKPIFDKAVEELVDKLRISHALFCLLYCGFLAGCGESIFPSRQTAQELRCRDGDNMLVLRRTRSSLGPGLRSGLNFDALLWMEKKNGKWTEKMRIDSNAFQKGSKRRRWIADIYSFKAPSGTAIIKVAEADTFMDSGHEVFTYSWREWSLITNLEIRTIRPCHDPFEGY